MTARTSPLETAAPSETLRAVTLPERWAVISFSIFIASITQIRSPSATSAPSLDGDFEHGALQRRGQRLAGGAGAAAGLALAFGRLLAAGRGGARRPPAASPITLTSKSLPETSTL